MNEIFWIRIGYWDWGLRLQIVIGDLDRRLRLGIKIRIWYSDWGLGLGDWNFGLGCELEIGIGD